MTIISYKEMQIEQNNTDMCLKLSTEVSIYNRTFKSLYQILSSNEMLKVNDVTINARTQYANKS